MTPKETNGILSAVDQVFVVDVRGLSVLALQVVGSMSATLQIEGSINGKDYFALNATPKDSSTPVTSVTAAGVWFAAVAGLVSAQVRCSAYTSGNPTIYLRAVKNGTPTAAGTGSGSTSTVSGPGASGSAASGNPVRVAGKYNASRPTFSDGNTADLQTDTRGNLATILFGTNGTSGANVVTSGSDAASFSNGLSVIAQSLRWTGAGWDRVRTGNIITPLSAVSVASEATVWTPTSSKKFRLMRGVVTASVDGNITFKDNTAGTIILVLPVKAGVPTNFDLSNGKLSAAANNVLTATGPAASTMSGVLVGNEE